MARKNWISSLPLILLASAIAFSPSFGAGELAGGSKIIEIRVEDILLIIFGLAWIAHLCVSGGKKLKKPPLLVPILVLLGFGFLSTLINLIVGTIETDRAFFYSLKEVEVFFLYFYVFYHITSMDSAKRMVWIWILLGVLNAGWISYELLTGSTTTFYYGPTLFAEPANPFASGIFFVLLFAFSLNVFLYYYVRLPISLAKKTIGALSVIMMAVGAFASGSQTAFFAFVAVLAASILLYTIKSKKPRLVFAYVVIVLLVGGIFVGALLADFFPERQFSLQKVAFELDPNQTNSRANIWYTTIANSTKHPLAPLIGLGKSFIGEAHNQYIRNFVETGVVGILLFLFLIFAIIRGTLRAFLREKDPFLIGVSGGLLATTLVMLAASMAGEAFLSVKISETYWFAAGITMAVLSLHKKKLPYGTNKT